MIGLAMVVITLALIAIGMPIAFALGLSSVVGLLLFDGWSGLDLLPAILFGGIEKLGFVAIPMFILMGTIIASTKASSDLYEALQQWLYKVPGGLSVTTVFASAVFAALSGSSPATSAAVGKIAIPETRKRGYPNDLSAGSVAAGGTLGILIPPSVTLIVYGVATETSIGRLFIAGIVPGLMLALMFSAWCIYRMWGNKDAVTDSRTSVVDRLKFLPRVLPFLAIIVGLLYVLYGGIATPSESAGVAAFLALVLAVLIYRMWDPRKLAAILYQGMRESVMLMMIIATSALFAYTLSYLYVTQSAAQGILSLDLNPLMLIIVVNIFLLVAGFFLPPVSIIVMAVPILLPLVQAVGFDALWFGILMTLNMEIGLITPPVGLNLYVLNGIAPDISLGEIIRGSLPFMLILVLGIVLIYLFPGIATWLPTRLMG